MRELESEQISFSAMPFMRFFLALVFGIAMGYLVAPHAVLYQVVRILTWLPLALFFLLILITRLRNYKTYTVLSVLFYLFLFALGWMRTWQPEPTIQAEHFSNHPSDALVGFVVDEPKITTKTIRYPLEVTHAIRGKERSGSKGRLLVSIRRDTLDKDTTFYRYGDQLLLHAKYDTIKSNYNPDEFNYQKYMIGQEIWHQSYLENNQLLKIGQGKGVPLIQTALEIRERMVAKFATHIEDNDVQAIASTLILGYRSDLDRDLLNTFSVTGTIHVLSVSGLHVGIIFSVFSFLLLWKKKSKWTGLKALLLVSLIWFYALITGLSPSVLRASIMLSLGILALSMVRRTNVYNTIAFSAFILLLYNPRFIVDIGFQLSYLSVLGIVYFYPKFNQLTTGKKPWLKALWSYISISLAAQLATFPLVTYYFYFFPVYFLPANLFILLPASLILYLGILVLLVPNGVILEGLVWLLETSINIMKEVLIYFENLPYASVNLMWNKTWHFLIIYTLILATVFFVYYKKKNALHLLYAILFILGLDWSIDKIRDAQSNQITIYNVGRNTAIGIFTQGKTYLYTDFDDKEHSAFQYSVKPNLSVLGKEPEFITAADTLIQDEVLVFDQFIQVGDKSLLIYEKQRPLAGKIDVDILYVKNNAMKSLANLYDHVQPQKMLLDATNAWWYIKEIEAEAKTIGIPVYVLKENNAYVW